MRADPYRSQQTEQQPRLEGIESRSRIARAGKWFGRALVVLGTGRALYLVDPMLGSVTELAAVVLCCMGLFVACFPARRAGVALLQLSVLVVGFGDVPLLGCAMLEHDAVTGLGLWIAHQYLVSFLAFLMVAHTALVALLSRRRFLRWPLLIPVAFVLLWTPLWATLEGVVELGEVAGSTLMAALTALVFAVGLVSLSRRHDIVLSTPEWWVERKSLPSRNFSAVALYPDGGARIHLPDGSQRDFCEFAEAVEWLMANDFVTHDAPERPLDGRRTSIRSRRGDVHRVRQLFDSGRR